MGRLYLRDESELHLVGSIERRQKSTVGDIVKKAWWKIRICMALVEIGPQIIAAQIRVFEIRWL